MRCDFKQGKTTVAFKMPGKYLWDASIIKAEGRYWLFCSMWDYDLGFGWNWLYHSKVVLAVSDKPEGPYEFVKVVLERRGPKYFDGMNTHNPNIKYHDGKFYLYYMGCTYDHEPPHHMDEITDQMINDTWNRKRIGLAISDKVDGDYIRMDEPILDPREGHWDETITTNPSVSIKPDGKSYMLYKSKRWGDVVHGSEPLQVGVAVSDKPEGPYERYSEDPILHFEGYSLEDPFVWYSEKKGHFCALLKDCNGNISGDWGNLVYAESDDFKNFELAEDPCVIERTVTWEDGSRSKQCNVERPSILFGEDGEPEYLFDASGTGDNPFWFKGETYIICTKLEKAK